MKVNLTSHRFNKKSISEFLKTSKKYRTDIFTMFFLDDGNCHYAFICPKKVATAVVRNKVRRQMKNSFLKHASKLRSNCSIIFIANKNILQSSFKNINDMILLSLEKKSLINEDS